MVDHGVRLDKLGNDLKLTILTPLLHQGLVLTMNTVSMKGLEFHRYCGY